MSHARLFKKGDESKANHDRILPEPPAQQPQVRHNVSDGKAAHDHIAAEKPAQQSQYKSNAPDRKAIGQAMQSGALTGAVASVGYGVVMDLLRRLPDCLWGEESCNQHLRRPHVVDADPSFAVFISLLVCLALYAAGGYFNQPILEAPAKSENEEAAEEEKRQYKRN
jgi:hypothetical protein